MTNIRDASLARARFLTTLLASFSLVGLAFDRRRLRAAVPNSLAIARAKWAFASRRDRRSRASAGWSSDVGWVSLVGWIAHWRCVALLATRAMSKLLFHTPPTIRATIVGVALLLAATSVVACMAPGAAAQSC